MKNIPKNILIIFFLAFLCTSLFASYSDTLKESNITIDINFNENYKVKKSTSSKGTITYEIAPTNKSFIFLISPFDVKSNRNQLKSFVQKNGEDLLPRTKEEKINLIEITKGDSPGFYYILTDKNPKENEFKFLYQGMLSINDFTIYFTYLSNLKSDKLPKEIRTLLMEIEITKSNSSNNNIVLLKKSDFPEDVNFGDAFLVKTFQIKNFYNNPDIYSSFIPKVITKSCQSIEYRGEKGSILYLKFDGKSKDAKSFLNGLFYGEGKQGSSEHPEISIYKEDMLVIVCFKNGKFKNKIISILKDKM